MAATLNLSSSKLPKIITEATKSLFQVFLSFKDNLVAFLLELERGGDLLVDGPGNLAAVLLELEGGGDLLIDGPGKSGHHASSQHSRCQTHCKSTNSSLPVILIVTRLKIKIE